MGVFSKSCRDWSALHVTGKSSAAREVQGKEQRMEQEEQMGEPYTGLEPQVHIAHRIGLARTVVAG